MDRAIDRAAELVGGPERSVGELPGRTLWLVLGLELGALVLVGFAVLRQPTMTADEWVAAAVVTGLGLAHIELTRPLERIRGRVSGEPYVELTSVWTFALALLLPMGFAAALTAAMHTYFWLRTWRTRVPLYRQVFNASLLAVTCLAASAAVREVRATLPPGSGPLATMGVEALGMLVYLTVNSALVAGVIAMHSAGAASAVDLIGRWEDNLAEIAALGLGGIVALVVPLNPWCGVFALPCLVVVQRAMSVRYLEEAASVDAKTGLLNAGAWHTRAQTQLSRAPTGRRQAVLVLDLDHFKDVNDQYGHLAGDRVLATVAAALLREVRAGDIVGRFGGEEFVILLTGDADGTDADLELVAERLRARVARLTVEVVTPDGPSTIRGLTTSVGGAVAAGAPVDLTTMVRRADAALYDAKRAGRNRVRMAGAGVQR